MGASTPNNRAVSALRRRGKKYSDGYLLYVADLLEDASVLLNRRGVQLQAIEAALGTALAHIDNEITDADREAVR